MFVKGQKIYKYELQTKLGNGAFGEVWLAKDISVDRVVALKILPASFSKVASTLEEARIGNKVNHKNLLEIYCADIISVEKDKNLVLIAQAYQENGSITKHLNARNFLTLPCLIKVLEDVLAGLEYLHNGNIIHNDIKPGNILMDKNNNAILSDYGISSVAEEGVSVSPKNTYLLHGAPEILSGKSGISVLTDIYQLGCTAYRLANGIDEIYIKEGITKEEFIKMKDERKLPSTKHQPYVPKKLAKIINKATELDPSKRYVSALEMRRDLEKLSFPGYWTTDENDTSKLVGIGEKYIYKYKIIPKAGNLFEVECERTNIKSGKSNKITDFCKKNMKEKDKDKLIYQYFEYIINNAK